MRILAHNLVAWGSMLCTLGGYFFGKRSSVVGAAVMIGLGFFCSTLGAVLAVRAAQR